jgi:hypothetical protein
MNRREFVAAAALTGRALANELAVSSATGRILKQEGATPIKGGS